MLYVDLYVNNKGHLMQPKKLFNCWEDDHDCGSIPLRGIKGGISKGMFQH